MNTRFSILLVFLFVSASATLFFLTKPPLLKGVSFSRAVYDDQHHLLRLTLSRDEKYRLFTPLAQVSQPLIAATLLQEDHYYRWHYGVNPFAVIKAGWQTYVVKSRREGASTITMQVARLRFGIHSKTLFGKIQQIIKALQLEMHYSKDQILEAYLNLAPYGNNIEGVGAASLVYFGKTPQQIVLPEALALSVIPQNPVHRKQSNLPAIRNKLFARWLEKHPQDKDTLSMIDLPLQLQTRHALPFLAPHFVNSVLQGSSSEQQEIQSTLNTTMQTILEKVTQRYLQRKKNLKVDNAAALLVDTRDMSIKAYIGSADYFNQAIQGQVDGVAIKRSPGSTLKPFIYALALDQGLIHPNTVLKDAPHSFGSYNPENFDYQFMGPIKAKEALVLSRNIPAIDLASQLQHPDLYELLEQADIEKLKSASYYGLALALGGGELTMRELTSLYAMLVNDGVWRPLRLFKDQPLPAGKQLLSPEASFLVLDMLKSPQRFGPQQLAVSWKTGTSSGFRDAWSIGAFGPYVLAVWIGRFDNTANPAFVGKNIAAPLFFEMIAALTNEMHMPKQEIHLEQLNVRHIPVCKVSGMLPTHACHDTELTWFIPGKSPITTDTVHREIAIDKNTGLRTCHFDQNTRFASYEFWSSDMLKIVKEAGMQRRTPPAYAAGCSLIATSPGVNPQIVSPRARLNYIIRFSTENNNLIPLTAIADGDVALLYWYIDETFLAKTVRDQPFLWHAKPGHYMVRVVDDHGRSDVSEIRVVMES